MKTLSLRRNCLWEIKQLILVDESTACKFHVLSLAQGFVVLTDGKENREGFVLKVLRDERQLSLPHV
jgi:hypothetical protein